MAPAPRAVSISFLTAGTVARQRGRAAQLPFIMSRIKSAVDLPSTVTGLSSGTGGALTVPHSVVISPALTGDVASMMVAARVSAVKRREAFMVSSLFVTRHGRA